VIRKRGRPKGIRMPRRYYSMFWNTGRIDCKDVKARILVIIFKAVKDKNIDLVEFNLVLTEGLRRIKQQNGKYR
jgi:hypothetical protein